MINENDVLTICNDVSKTKIRTEKEHVDLYYSKIDEESINIPVETIPKKLRENVRRNPNFEVLKYKSDPKGDFDLIVTMAEYLKQIENAARSFIKLGLEPRASVGIIGFNHPAWFISELGSIFAGGFACGIYTTNNAHICKFIMTDCNCQIAVVENDYQLQKILSIANEIPNLKAIIKYIGAVAEETKHKYSIPIYSWTEFLAIGSDDVQVELEKRIEHLKSNECAVLIYTSGTTGLPKGVMLSHDNVLFTAAMVAKEIGISSFKHSIISYLPLSHIAANILDIISTVAIGTTIYFAQADALKGTLGKTLREVRPSIFIGVPRVFEKIQEQMQDHAAQKNNEKRSESSTDNKSGNVDKGKLKKVLGFDRCVYIASAAAPLSIKTFEFFLNLHITIHQVYGMSECSGPHTLGMDDKIRIGSVGCLMKGAELKIYEPDENLVGEICMRGRHIFIGYFNAPQKTEETMDKDGWLHSGDLGKMLDDEYLMITGRIKELIITAGGENVAPVPIEDKIKEELPFISNVMLVGDHKKFISCLLTLKTIINPDTQIPTNKLTPSAIKSLQSFGIEATNSEDVLKSSNPNIKKSIDSAMEKVNSSSTSRAAYIQKWTFLPNDFSIGGGELGPTLKLKRMVIDEKYSELINSLYN